MKLVILAHLAYVLASRTIRFVSRIDERGRGLLCVLPSVAQGEYIHPIAVEVVHSSASPSLYPLSAYSELETAKQPPSSYMQCEKIDTTMVIRDIS